MTTFADVAERALGQWLVPPDEQPIRFSLAAELDSAATSLTYSSSLLPPELEDLLGPGVLVETSLEQILLGTVDVAAGTVSNLIRGANGTSPATHPDGSLITVSPVFTRRSVLDAVLDATAALHPQLFWSKSSELVVEDWNEAPSDMIAPVNFTFVDSLGLPVETSVQWSGRFPDSETGKAVAIQAVPGTKGWLNYRARFPRPISSGSEELADLGVKESWAGLLVVAGVHRTIAGRDLAAATQELLTRQLAQQGFPVPSASRTRDGLVSYYEYLMSKAVNDLRAEHDPIMVSTFPQDSLWR